MMNERIKELVDKTNDLTDKEYSTDWWNAQSFYQSIWQEKFAELIVLECVQILDNFGTEQTAKHEQPAHHPGLNFLVGLKIVEATWKIKTHFGVE